MNGVTRMVAASGLVVLLSGCLTNNIPQTVRTGELFRTKQLSPNRLETVIEKYGIRSIVNLRGPSPGADWYDDEQEVAQKYSVIMRSYKLSASRWPTPDVLQDLLHAIETLPGPTLIHCRGGADRTGLLSGLLVANDGASDRQALRHLGLRFGHVGIWQGTGVMDDVLALYLQDRKQESIDLPTWVVQKYPAYFTQWESLGQ